MRGFLVLCFIACVIILSGSAVANSGVTVTDIRYWSYPEYTRLVVGLSGEAQFKASRLSSPDRLYFDVTNSTIEKGLQRNLTIENGMLKRVRAAQFDERTVRVVLDLGTVADFKVFTLDDPMRIVVDVFGPVVFSTKRRIVLDPGHGGHDPGAVGPNNLYEKDVVLDIALKLRDLLAQDPDLEVSLTRDRDVFISLEERTAIANSRNADLFISIHANASPRRTVRGMETYLLNWTNDEEAMKVAARENAISLKKMRKMQKEMDIIDIIKSDLTRETKRDESIRLANYVQNSMVKDLNKSYDHIVDLGVKQALFYVLFGAKMPSVLVEVSFISNPLEEKLLAKEAYREELARSIAGGIQKYLSAPPSGQRMAAVR